MASEKPIFLVDPYSSPVAVKVTGRASFQNVGPLKDFLKEAYGSGSRKFVFDFSQCTGMDSTVLGVLAGCALELRRMKPKGSLVLSRLGTRNMELVRNLGLHRIATVDTGGEKMDSKNMAGSLETEKLDELESARLCLEAHENLIETDKGNRAKFQDVLTFLKNRVQEEEP